MKRFAFTCLLLTLLGPVGQAQAQGLTAREIVKRSDDLMQGESSISTMSMEIVRPTWTRTIAFRSWSKGRDRSATLITAPARDKGQSFLKVGNEMWSWNPTVNRLIKLPPSMMSQGWMGSDYTNDDILRESSVVNDFDHTLVGEQTIDGMACHVIDLKPKPDAAVVWGRIRTYITKDRFISLKSEYYDEDGHLVRTHLQSQIRRMHDRELPTRIEVIPADEPGNRTVVTIQSMEFNVPIRDDFFTQQNIQRLR